MACLPIIIRLGDSFSTTALRTFEIPKGSTSKSVSTKIALSAPKASAVLSCSCAFSAPTVTAIISVAEPASLSLTASSTAISQKGLMAIFTLLRSTPDSSAFGLTFTL